jgi:hypothetical protein
LNGRSFIAFEEDLEECSCRNGRRHFALASCGFQFCEPLADLRIAFQFFDEIVGNVRPHPVPCLRRAPRRELAGRGKHLVMAQHGLPGVADAGAVTR